MDKQIIKQTILNNKILEVVKACSDREYVKCAGCVLNEYDCPFLDLKSDLVRSGVNV